MATSVDQVAGYLDEMGLNYTRQSDSPTIITGFQTQNYVNRNGDHSIMIVIAIEENGEFIKVFAPLMYSYPQGPHTEAIMQTLLNISYLTKMLQFEFDSKDGEIRAMVEFPIEDSTLTLKQLARCISVITMLGDHYHSIIFEAIDKGKKADEESFIKAEYEQKLAMIRRQKGEIGLEE